MRRAGALTETRHAMSDDSLLLELVAPLSGFTVPLEEVPDPVFAQKIVGDGISIEPTSSQLLAPVAGVVVQLHRAHHALTLRTAGGIEVLLHIGVDTVNLKGAGFTPLVQQGDTVAVGQALIGFDADGVGRAARSLMTQVLVANAPPGSRITDVAGQVQAGSGVLFRLRGQRPASAPADVGQGDWASSEPVVIPNAAGLHARPAAVLAVAAKRFGSALRLQRGAQAADAKSLVAVLGLSVQHGDRITVQARGTDAPAAIAALRALLASGCGESATDVPAAPAPDVAAPAHTPQEGVCFGLTASPGVAVGTVHQWRRRITRVVEAGQGVAHESAALTAALDDALAQIRELQRGAQDVARVQILEAHCELLQDPGLLDATRSALAGGQSAAYCWQQAYSGQAQLLAHLDNPLLRERANDIRDVGQRVLGLLTGMVEDAAAVPAGSIVCAQDLTPSEAAAFDPQRVLGFCTTGGGATGHVAILARSLGLPALCAIDAQALDLADGSLVVLDASDGRLIARPDAGQLAQARAQMAALAHDRAASRRDAALAAVTRDGHRVEVAANVRNAQDAAAAVAAGGDGVGLLRSEFLFEERADAPSEAEQQSAYEAVARALGPQRTLVVRTLDAGGDKPLPFLPLPHEDNPFLGVRGIRASFAFPDLLRTQLRAIARCAAHSRLHIMFPMVASIEELRTARRMLAEEMAAIGVAGPVQVGIMVEVPSAALTAECFAAEVDFFSIGTNDLTQYTLAMDRGHPRLAAQADALHPAVLRLIDQTVRAAHAAGKWVGVCGGLAAEALAVPVLVGLGVDELSVPVPAIAQIKAQVRALDYARCQELARRLLALADGQQVRRALKDAALTTAAT